MWRVATVNGFFSMDHIEEVLQQVPCRADHSTDNEEEGRADVILAEYAEKGGFSCVPWTENALRALRDEGVIKVTKEISKIAFHIIKERERSFLVLTGAAGAIVKEARAKAGPEDAKLMVGKDFGGLRIVN